MNHNFILGLLGGSANKESACNTGDIGLIPGSERSPGKGMTTHSAFLLGESHRERSLEGCSYCYRVTINMGFPVAHF